MARDREFLPIFLDFNDTTQDLTDEQCGRLIRALVAYANGMEYEIAGVELIAFRFLKGYIDRNRVLSEKRAEAGSKGGQQTAANNTKRQQEEANTSKNGNNSYFDNNRDIGNHINQIKTQLAAEGWTMTDIDLAIDRCRGKEIKRDLLSYVRKTLANMKKERSTVLPTPAQNFEQRDYSGVDAELMAQLAAEVKAFNDGQEAVSG